MFLAFEGFGLITNAAEEMKDPAATLPRALYANVLFKGLIYVLLSLAVMGNLNSSQVSEALRLLNILSYLSGMVLKKICNGMDFSCKSNCKVYIIIDVLRS